MYLINIMIAKIIFLIKYKFFLISLLGLFLFSYQNIYSKVLYDKLGIIITDIDVQNYSDLYKQSKNIELSPSQTIKQLVLQTNILNDLIKNNPNYLLKIDQDIVSNYGEQNYNNKFIRDFIRFQKVKEEFIFDYYNNNLDLNEFKKIIISFKNLNMPISNNSCLTIIEVVDLKNNNDFIEDYFRNIKNNKNEDYSVIINKKKYQVCLNEKIKQKIDNSIIQYIETQIQESFNSFIYEKIEN